MWKRSKRLVSKPPKPHSSQCFTTYIKGKRKREQPTQSKGAKIAKDQAHEVGGTKPSVKEIKIAQYRSPNYPPFAHQKRTSRLSVLFQKTYFFISNLFSIIHPYNTSRTL